MVLVMVNLIILMNMKVEIIGVIYNCISFCILFLSFGYNYNVISLCSFLNVVIFSNIILCFIV